MAKFLMISNKPVDDSMAYILAKNGILNLASAFLNMNGEVEIRIFNLFAMNVNVVTSPNKDSLALLFPDKLKDLHGHIFKITFFHELTEKIINIDDIFKTKLIHFLLAVQKAQRAQSQFYLMNTYFSYKTKFKNGNMTLSLNKVKSRIGVPQLQTYDVAGYCALIPHNKRESRFTFALFKPFAVSVQLCLFLSLFAMMIVWRMYKV